jgi:hypothetical protein
MLVHMAEEAVAGVAARHERPLGYKCRECGVFYVSATRDDGCFGSGRHLGQTQALNLAPRVSRTGNVLSHGSFGFRQGFALALISSSHPYNYLCSKL